MQQGKKLTSLSRNMSDALSKRIKATDEQIERIEGAISVAEENERRFTEKVYNAMIAGYRSILKDLENDKKNYMEQLEG